MRVAIIGTRGYPSYYGGFETAVRRLAPYLSDQGWEVTVYGRRAAAHNEGDPRIRVELTAGLESKSLSTLSYGATATLAARRLKPDAALVMNVANGYFLPLLRRAKIPTLVNVDGIEWEREKWGRAARAVFRGGARATARWADMLVFDSVNIENRWKNEFGRDGVYIPYGGDATSGTPVPLGLAHRSYVLMVARFVPENTVAEFLDAASTVAAHYPVVIVGSSGYGGDLDRMAAQLDEREPNVTWMGHVSSDDLLHSLWEHAGVYFHGHSVGGTNPALVQAMAAGAPVLARDTVYSREVLGPSGEFVPPHSAHISARILELMADRPKLDDISASNRARAEAEYTWEEVGRRYDAALRMVVGHPRRTPKNDRGT